MTETLKKTSSGRVAVVDGAESRMSQPLPDCQAGGYSVWNYSKKLTSPSAPAKTMPAPSDY